eukprot:Amastigsp_a843565_216.p1 type:complete len:400 gc:universal Amastigsp_a843565_216:1232-33(-)
MAATPMDLSEGLRAATTLVSQLEDRVSGSLSARHASVIDECRARLALWPQLYTRSLVPLSETLAPARGLCLRVMQFNVLADGLSGSDPTKGGFTSVPPACLDWELRKFRILEEILRADPDVLCLEELDHYYDWAQPVFEALGYASAYIKKPKSPCLKNTGGRLEDGCAVFVRAALFEIERVEAGPLVTKEGTPQNQVSLTAWLRVRATGRTIVTVVAHLKADKTAEGESIRAEQIDCLLARIESQCPPSPVVLLCLDMNAAPRDSSKYAALAYQKVLDHHMHLESAYGPPNTAAEPEYTTWKVRGAEETPTPRADAPGELFDEAQKGAATPVSRLGEAKHTIDYIFYTKASARVRALWTIPGEDQVVATRLPGFEYPSDHFALLAVIEVLDAADAHATS